MNLRQQIERECVKRLLDALGPQAALESLEPPEPDVRATYSDVSVEVFEVTEIHPDEAPDGGGSLARAQEEQRARADPHGIVCSAVPADPLPGVLRRIEEKCRKAPGYMVRPHETLSLLLAGSLPMIGAPASTFVFPPFLDLERLDGESHDTLARSRFKRAYLHLHLSGNAVWEWNRASRWFVRRPPDDTSREGREMLKAIKGLGSGDVLPGTKIVGRWP